MALIDKQIVQKLANTTLMNNEKTLEIMDRIVFKAWNEAKNEDDEQIIGALALKFNLPCADYIINEIEINGFTLPF